MTGAGLQRVEQSSAITRPALLDGLDLTSRERDVLGLIVLGLNSTEIAARLHLTVSTVKTHVGNVLAKTGSRDRVHAAIVAIQSGLAWP